MNAHYVSGYFRFALLRYAGTVLLVVAVFMAISPRSDPFVIASAFLFGCTTVSVCHSFYLTETEHVVHRCLDGLAQCSLGALLVVGRLIGRVLHG